MTLGDALAILGVAGSAAGVLVVIGRASRRLDDMGERHNALAKESRERLAALELRTSSLETHRAEVNVRLSAMAQAIERIEKKLDDALMRASR